jgi:hypothetical protein
MNQLRQRVFHAFTTGSAEELAAVLQLLLILSTHHTKEPGKAFTPSPVHNDRCNKLYPDYLIATRARN